MKEIDQATDKKAREILNKNAKEACRQQMTGTLMSLALWDKSSL